MSDVLAKIYQVLYQATGSDLAPVLVFAILLVLLGLAVGHVVMLLLRRLRPTQATK